MADEHRAEPKQTTPKGAEIPVPKRREFFENLAKVAPPVEPPAESEAERDGD